MNYAQHSNTKATPQTEPVPGKAQVENSAGGFGFALDKWKMLERFLILGSEGGTYYASEEALTQENAKNVIACIKENGSSTVAWIRQVSDKGLAPKNDPAIFALALCTVHGDEDTKKMAYAQIHKICRTGTHLFTFCQAVQDMRGWSRGLRKGVAKFYLEREAEQMAYQLIKYRQRNGWTHKDVIKLAHPATKDAAKNALLKWAIGKAENAEIPKEVHDFVNVQEIGKNLEGKAAKKALIEIIEKGKLPWEALPTQALSYPEVWEALLPGMPLTALIRNLGRLASLEVTESILDHNTKLVVDKLLYREGLKKARIHPLGILNALKTYSMGRGDKGSLNWKPVAVIKDALNEAFYRTFETIEPTNKNWLLGLDVSGSMAGGNLGGMNITPAEGVATMAMVTARVEKSTEIYGFTDRFQDLGITPKDTLETAIRKVQLSNFGRTDCAMPIVWAHRKRLKVDAFAIYTDNETYAGLMHPYQALLQYRRDLNPTAKLIVVGMTSTGFSIADPNDAGMLDVVGFNASTPQVMANFVR